MPPKKSQIPCPRCHQPLIAQIEQLFDVTSDPGAKQRLLGGISNYAVCQNCGFNGPLATPIVYHDADKELLLTFFPAELNLPVNEQEKLIGPLINQVTNRLAPEKRKAYLLRPQSFLTYQSLIERILGADGITPEMIQAQQKRVSLVEQLLGAKNAEARSAIIQQSTDLLDAEFFAIFSRLMEATLSSGQEQAAKEMDAVQQQLLSDTEYGRQIASQANEIQEAVKTLQAAGKELNREKLLEIIVQAPNDDRLNALVSLTRPGLDYLFFQNLSELIGSKSGDEKKKLVDLRTKLLDMTQKMDQRAEEEYKRSKELLDTILGSEDVQDTTLKHLGEINDTFVQILNREMQEAKKQNDASRTDKLEQVIAVLQKASAPPAELALVEELLSAPDDAALKQLLEKHAADLTPEFASMVGSILARTEEQAGQKPRKEEAEVIDRLQKLYRAILNYSMKKNLVK